MLFIYIPNNGCFYVTETDRQLYAYGIQPNTNPRMGHLFTGPQDPVQVYLDTFFHGHVGFVRYSPTPLVARPLDTLHRRLSDLFEAETSLVSDFDESYRLTDFEESTLSTPAEE